MKKIFLFAFLLTFCITACRKKSIDPIFGDPNQRIADTLAARQDLLTSAAYGWKTVFSPKGGGTFLFWMKFDEHNRVDMVSDFNSETAGEVKNSSYVVKSIEKPGLVFDTYNYLHILSHPQNATSGGNTSGEGRVSDYEFWFESVAGDSIVLKGMRNGNTMVLHRATEEEAAFFTSGGINRIMNEAIELMSGKFLRLEEGSIQIPATINFTNKRLTLMRIGSDNSVEESNYDFTFDADGLNLTSSLTYAGKSYDKVYWDEVNKAFYLLNGSEKIVFSTSVTPAILPYNPPAQDLLYPGEFAVLKTNPAAIPQIGRFRDILEEDIATVHAAERTYSYFYFDFQPAPSDGTISFNVRTASSTYFIGKYYYNLVWIDKDQGIFKLEYVRANTTNSGTLSYSQSVRNLLGTHTFKLAYLAVPGPADATIIGMISVEEPDIFLFGAAGPSLTGLP